MIRNPWIRGAVLGAFLAGSRVLSAPADGGDAGELKIYDPEIPMSTGTVASRTFRDSAGRVSRIIYYSSGKIPFSRNGPFQERDLKPQEIQLYYYYDNGQRRKMERTSVDGIKSSEVRYDASGQKAVDIDFDATGKYVVAMRGVVQQDIDLPHGWGDAVNGAACGIVLTRERGRLDEIQVRLNLRTTPSWPPFQKDAADAFPDARMLLRDAAGNDIPEARGRQSKQWHLGGREVGYLVPGYPLAERFPGLPRGRYTLRVQQVVPDLGMTLLSNEVTFVVE